MKNEHESKYPILINGSVFSYLTKFLALSNNKYDYAWFPTSTDEQGGQDGEVEKKDKMVKFLSSIYGGFDYSLFWGYI